MPSFSIKLINIFVGLFTGTKNRFLQEYSSKLSALDYRLIEIEPTFSSASGKVNPEALAHSTSRQQSLQVEWTQLSNPTPAKISQIRRYSNVHPQDVAGKVGLLPKSVNTWLIAADHCEPDYYGVLQSLPSGVDKKIMLCSFTSNPGSNILKRTRGAFEDLELSALLQGGILIKRIPYDYVKIDLNNLQSSEITKLTIRQLVNFHARQIHEVTSEQVASEAFGAWDFLSEEKKSSLKKRILKIVKTFSDSVGKRHIERVLNEPPTWILKGRLTSFQKVTKQYIQDLAQGDHNKSPKADRDLLLEAHNRW